MSSTIIFYFLFLLLLAVGTIESSIDKVKNFKIEYSQPQHHPELLKRSDMKAESIKAVDGNILIFPDEITATFEAFGNLFTLKLRKNNDLISKDLTIVTLNEEGETSTNTNGVAYNGISLEIRSKNSNTKSKSKTTPLKDPFARFFATQREDGSLRLQGGFEWDRNFFKLTNENHPHVKYHVSPDEISLLKRSYPIDEGEGNDFVRSAASKKENTGDGDFVILKESMDAKNNHNGAFGFGFNSGSNSTTPFRCGHDDLTFNTDPRGVGNDFVTKLTKREEGKDDENGNLDENDENDHSHHSHNNQKSHHYNSNINPLTAQYYFSKKASLTATKDQMDPGENGCPVNRKVLYLGIAVDSAYLEKFNGDRQAAVSNILSDFNLVSAIYEETFNIELGITTVTILGKSDGKRTNDKVPWDLPCDSNFDINDRLSALSKWRDNQSKDLGLYHLVSGCSESATVGIAWMNQVCQTKSFKGGKDPNDIVSGTSVSVLIPNQFAVIAHEIGHNFGAIHDCDAKECQSCRGRDCKCCTCGPCDCKGKYVMNPESGGLNVREFSPCTINDVCYKLNVIGKCLQEPGRVKTIKKATCGNGILEEGEDCDCGTEEECKGNPCCSFGCKLREGAKCSDGNEPCCKKCQYRKLEDNFKCFTSKSQCQKDSICDGNSGKCPPIGKATNGIKCELDGGTCASGICTSRDLQCIKVGKRLGITKSCKKMRNTCRLTCDSSGECVTMDAYFMDGTPCGSRGTCSAGQCSEYSISGFMEDNSALVVAMGATVGALIFILLLRALFTLTRRRT